VPQRTTLTLEDDVAESVRREASRTGKAIKTVVNEALRRGLSRRPDQARRFRVQARPLGVRPEIELDDVEGLLDRIEGPDRR
jgi:SpoVK/Ycf46/Vps4 family AAA+-type ATPase